MSRQLSVETFETTNPLEAFDYAQAVIQVHADQEEGGPRSPTSRELSTSHRLENSSAWRRVD